MARVGVFLCFGCSVYVWGFLVEVWVLGVFVSRKLCFMVLVLFVVFVGVFLVFGVLFWLFWWCGGRKFGGFEVLVLVGFVKMLLRDYVCWCCVFVGGGEKC